MSSGIVITDDDMEKIPHHHKEIFKTLIANMNKTFHETLNQTRGRNPEQSQELDSWTSSQVLLKDYFSNYLGKIKNYGFLGIQRYTKTQKVAFHKFPHEVKRKQNLWS
jgi:hypothetical protein